MTSEPRRRTLPGPRSCGQPGQTDELRRMVLLLETAAVLEARARRARDPAQVPILLKRAEQRRQEAAELREKLAARGAALDPRQVERIWPSSARREQFSRRSPDGRMSRS